MKKKWTKYSKDILKHSMKTIGESLSGHNTPDTRVRISPLSNGQYRSRETIIPAGILYAFYIV